MPLGRARTLLVTATPWRRAHPWIGLRLAALAALAARSLQGQSWSHPHLCPWVVHAHSWSHPPPPGRLSPGARPCIGVHLAALAALAALGARRSALGQSLARPPRVESTPLAPGRTRTCTGAPAQVQRCRGIGYGRTIKKLHNPTPDSHETVLKRDPQPPTRRRCQVRAAPRRTAPPRTAPRRAAPRHTAPHRAAPHRAVPRRTAPHRATPRRAAPRLIHLVSRSAHWGASLAPVVGWRAACRSPPTRPPCPPLPPFHPPCLRPASRPAPARRPAAASLPHPMFLVSGRSMPRANTRGFKRRKLTSTVTSGTSKAAVIQSLASMGYSRGEAAPDGAPMRMAKGRGGAIERAPRRAVLVCAAGAVPGPHVCARARMRAVDRGSVWPGWRLAVLGGLGRGARGLAGGRRPTALARAVLSHAQVLGARPRFKSRGSVLNATRGAPGAARRATARAGIWPRFEARGTVLGATRDVNRAPCARTAV